MHPKFNVIEFTNIFKTINIHKSKYLLLPKKIQNSLSNTTNKVLGNVNEDESNIYITLMKQTNKELTGDNKLYLKEQHIIRKNHNNRPHPQLP